MAFNTIIKQDSTVLARVQRWSRDSFQQSTSHNKMLRVHTWLMQLKFSSLEFHKYIVQSRSLFKSTVLITTDTQICEGTATFTNIKRWNFKIWSKTNQHSLKEPKRGRYEDTSSRHTKLTIVLNITIMNVAVMTHEYTLDVTLCIGPQGIPYKPLSIHNIRNKTREVKQHLKSNIFIK